MNTTTIKDASTGAALKRNWSIVGMLGVYITFFTCSLVFICIAISFWSLNDAIFTSTNEDVNDHLNIYRTYLQELPHPIDIIKRNLEYEEMLYQKYPDFYTRVLDKNGNTVTETVGMSDVLPSSLFRAPSGTAAVARASFKREGLNRRAYQLNSALVENSKAAGAPFTVQAAMDRTTEDEILTLNYLRIGSLLVFAALFSLFMAKLVVEKLLDPVRQLVEITEGITVENMRRIDPRHWPRELQQMSAAFNGMIERLENSFVRISNYASNMAHEIRTPLGNLLGEAEVTLSQERTPEEYVQFIESAVEECNRLSRLVNGLLFLARAGDPESAINRCFFDPSEEVRGIIALLDPLIEERQAVVHCCESGVMSGDPFLFRRGVINLITNALNYGPEGVVITVSMRRNLDDSVDIAVSDTGYGIEASHLGQIFDRFYRADAARSNYSKGSGLGLSIVKAIMDMHRGRVDIESTVGEGTTVTLHFPAHAKPQEFISG